MKQNRKKRLILFFALFFRLSAVSYAAAGEITIVADFWCPYNCDPDSDKPGFMVEITKEIFKEHGETVNYHLISWNRALSETHRGLYNGVIAGNRINTRNFSPDFVFPEIEQAEQKKCFFVLKDNPWKYTGINSLINQRIGIIDGYSYPGIQSYIDRFKNTLAVQAISGDDALKMNMRKLAARNRITAVVEDERVFEYAVIHEKYSGQFRNAGCDNPQPEAGYIYIAFTPASINPKSVEYAKIMSEGMKKIRKDGRLAAILKKYGLKDRKQ